MKRKELARQLTKAGCVLLRHGSNHDVYVSAERNEAAGSTTFRD
jgi:hypothetical protein